MQGYLLSKYIPTYFYSKIGRYRMRTEKNNNK